MYSILSNNLHCKLSFQKFVQMLAHRAVTSQYNFAKNTLSLLATQHVSSTLYCARHMCSSVPAYKAWELVRTTSEIVK